MKEQMLKRDTFEHELRPLLLFHGRDSVVMIIYYVYKFFLPSQRDAFPKIPRYAMLSRKTKAPLELLCVELNGSLGSKTTLRDIDLGDGGIDTAESVGLIVGELVHSALGQVEASAGVVNSEDVDGLAVVGDGVALAALGGVPAGDVA